MSDAVTIVRTGGNVNTDGVLTIGPLLPGDQVDEIQVFAAGDATNSAGRPGISLSVYAATERLTDPLVVGRLTKQILAGVTVNATPIYNHLGVLVYAYESLRLPIWHFCSGTERYIAVRVGQSDWDNLELPEVAVFLKVFRRAPDAK